MFTRSQLDFLSNYRNIGVACSGGVDSMVLCDLLLTHKIKFSVIHCNFMLRGESSDFDQIFVQSYAVNNELTFHTTSFETEKHSRQSGTSIEMEARALRYAYFETIALEKELDLILLAHHKDDHVETILMRIITGTGLSGLMGIREYKAPFYYRPLRNRTKETIKQYAKQNGIRYSEDHSNSENIYLRNILRNLVLPYLHQINPSYRDSLNQLSEIASQSKDLLVHSFYSKKDGWQKEGKVDLSEIRTLDFLPLVLAYILEDLELNRSLIKNIADALVSKESKYFSIGEVQIEVKNGTISEVRKAEQNEIIFKTLDDFMSYPYCKIQLIDAVENYQNEVLYLDKDGIQFPIKLRKMEAGDKIQALGLKGYKKISDIAQEMRWTKTKKNKPIVLIDGSKEIIALLGWRISEMVKIKNTTSQILMIRME